MREIRLQGGLSVIVDEIDFEKISGFKWYAMKARNERYYARHDAIFNGNVVCTLMHRLIAQAEIGSCVDHINGNGLDNRRSNLRIAPGNANRWNRGPAKSNHGYKGVYKVERPNSIRYRATLRANKVVYRLGSYLTPEEAAAAYDRKAIEIHGEFAWLNGIELPAGPVLLSRAASEQ